MADWAFWGPALYRRLRDQIRERGEDSVDPVVLSCLRRVAAEMDTALRVEAISDGGDLIIIDCGNHYEFAGFSNRRLIVLQREAVGELERVEKMRRSAGWFGNLPVVVE